MVKVDINKEILIWAINRRGISPDTIKEKIPEIEEWLTGKDKPTTRQLEQLARMLNISFSYHLECFSLTYRLKMKLQSHFLEPEENKKDQAPN